MRAVWLAFALALCGCASAPDVKIGHAELPRRAELTNAPFFAQDAYQCGPAALATVLVQRGRAVTPVELKDRVYLPRRQGSLQVEMVAAARGHGLLVYPLEPRLEQVVEAVAAGHPVLVLQNLAFERWPQWHFAVVVGYDLDRGVLVLRSGTKRRHIETLAEFDRSWRKGGRWAVLTLEPGDITAQVERLPWLQAAADLETTGQLPAAETAYRAAARRWGDAISWFALGNARFAMGDTAGAEQALRESVAADASFAAAWSNLAHVLADRRCLAEAKSAQACSDRLGATGEAPASLIMQGDDARCAPAPVCPLVASQEARTRGNSEKTALIQ